MQWTKRVAAIIVSICLLAIAVYFSYQPEMVNAGEGTGVNKPVQTMTDLNKVFSSMDHLGVSGVSSAAAETADDFYSSMSITETSDLTRKTEYSSDNIKISSTVVFRRTLDIYLTEGAAYYASKGITSSKTSQHNDDTTQEETSYFSFDWRIYLSADLVLIKANELDYFFADETGQAEEDPMLETLRANRGQWLDCTSVPDFAEALLYGNNLNMDTMGLISNIISTALEDDTLFTQSGNLYTFAQSFEEMYGEGVGGDFFIDFSNSVAPRIDYDINGSAEGSGVTVSMREMIDFRYVDNTVISLADTMDALDLAALMSEEEN